MTTPISTPVETIHIPDQDNKLQEYGLLSKLATGKYGTVFLYQHIHNQQMIVCKLMAKRNTVLIDREMDCLSKLSHPSIIKAMGFYQTESHAHIFTEYVPNSRELASVIRKKKFSPEQIISIFYQIVDALIHFHENNIVHRDIKPRNILINPETCQIKIIDFGFSREVPKEGLVKTQCGTPTYMAPEILSGKPYDPKKSDIWSLGITLFMLATGKKPFEHQNMAQLIKLITSGEYSLPESIDPGIKDLIKALLNPDPDKRIALEDLKTHPTAEAHQFFPLSFTFIEDYFSIQ
jgi:serine/threonine protein kinase